MRIVVLFSAVCALVVAGCSRKTGETAKLSVGLPPAKVVEHSSKVHGKGVSTFGSATLRHVVINVTASGMSPVYYAWDGHDNAGPTPTSFDVTVTKGSDRLIQVLAVYQDDASGGMAFSYGDAKKTISGADSVDITVTTLSGTTQSVSGRISGRYLTTDNTGPTGSVGIKFQPGSGKPAMLIETGMIVNGWFSLFGLSGVPLAYELSDKSLLFDGPVSLNNAMFDPNANSGAEWSRIVRAHVPVAVRVESDGTMSAEEAKIYIWGYFGNALARVSPSWSTRSVCKSSMSGSLSRMKMFNVDKTTWASQSQLNVSNYVNVGLTLPTESQMLAQGSPMSDAVFLGGNYDGGNCPISPLTASDEFTTFYSVNKELINGRGNDSVAGFRGPFRLDSNGNPFTVTFTGNRVITGTLLPGAETAVGAFKLYKKIGVSQDFWLEDPSCTSIPAGFVGAGTTTPTSTAFSLQSSISDADAAAGVAAILCGSRADGTVYPTGIFMGRWIFPAPGNNGGGASSGPATKVKVVPHASPGNAVYNQSCIPVDVFGVKDDGTMASHWQLSGGNPYLTLTTDSGTSSNAFYTNDACNSTLYYGWTPGTWTNPVRLFYKSFNSGSGGFNMFASMTSLPSYGSTAMTYSDSPGSANYVRFFNYPQSTINAFQCYPLGMQTVYGSSGQTAANPGYGGPTSSTLNSSSTNVKFYTTPDCGTSSQAINANFSGTNGMEITTQYRYFRYESGTSANETISVSPNWGGGATSQQLTYSAASIVQPGAATAFQIDLPDTLDFNACQPALLKLVDANGRLKPATSPFSISVTSTSSRLQFFDQGCWNTPNSIPFPGDGVNASMTVYVKALSSGPTTVNFNGGNGVASSRNFTINPEMASNAFVLWPGMLWASGGTSPSGSALPLFMGQTYTAKVVATGPSGHVISNYVSPGSSSFATSGSAPFSVIGQTPFTVGSYGTASFSFQPLTTFSWLYLNLGGIVSQAWGLPNLGSWGANFYYMPTNATAVVSQQGPSLLSTNVCKPVLLQMNSLTTSITETGRSYFAAYTAGSGGGPLESGTPSQSYAALYNENTCTTSLGGSQTVIPTGDSTGLVYMKATVGSNNANITLPFINTWAGAGPIALASNLATTSATAGPHTGYNLLGVYELVEGKCNGFALEAVDASGYTVNITDTVTLNGGGMTIYSDPLCSTQNNTLSFSGVGVKKFYARHNAVIGIPQATVNFSWTDTSSHSGGSGSIYILNYLPDP